MTRKITLTTLRKQIYQVMDHVLNTGIPVEIERKGRHLFIVPDKNASSKLGKLKKRKGIVGNPDDLIHVKAAKWTGEKHLK